MQQHILLVHISKKSEWSIKPLKGITEKSIKETLEGETISVDGEEWLIEKSNIKDLKINKQSTDIKNKKDKVAVLHFITFEKRMNCRAVSC